MGICVYTYIDTLPRPRLCTIFALGRRSAARFREEGTTTPDGASKSRAPATVFSRAPALGRVGLLVGALHATSDDRRLLESLSTKNRQREITEPERGESKVATYPSVWRSARTTSRFG